MAEKKKIISLGKGGASEVNWGSIGGTLSDQTDLQDVLNTIPTATSDLENDSGFITQDDVKAYKDFPSGWHKSGTMDQLISDIAADSTVTEGMSYLATVSFSDLPASLIQGEMTVDIMEYDENLGKTVKFTLCSSNQSPYHWEYISAYGASGTWRSWLVSQVNADWNASSGVSQILNKPTIPSSTSDLNNDSGFITLNDVPAQVQSDWNQSDNTQVDFIKNKPTIPAAQVNADWNASSGVSQILNKPTIPAAQIQSDWNQSNNQSLDYIKNKPSMSTETLTFVDANNVSTTVVVYIQPQI